jgi:hypothetical protein
VILQKWTATGGPGSIPCTIFNAAELMVRLGEGQLLVDELRIFMSYGGLSWRISNGFAM